jgi:hypothetical protein
MKGLGYTSTVTFAGYRKKGDAGGTSRERSRCSSFRGLGYLKPGATISTPGVLINKDDILEREGG